MEDNRNRWKDPRVHSSDARQTTVRQSRLAIGSHTPLSDPKIIDEVGRVTSEAGTKIAIENAKDFS